jgi:ABC-2 type transport system ATP-binding protein
MTTEAAFSFDGATKRYGDVHALSELTLTVPAGVVFALVGPNGAGKTTAIGLLTGLLAPNAGRAAVFGVDLAERPVEAKRLLGFVPDRPYLWPRWTPRETLRFVGAVFGGRGAALEVRIGRELSAFGLDDAADRTNETLSHGTRQKVALAQAFLHDPALFVLDEPMVGLDPLAQRLLVARLRERTAEGAAVLLTTHHLALAEEVADDAGVLVKGKLVARGQPLEMTARGRTGRLSELFFDLAEDDDRP